MVDDTTESGSKSTEKHWPDKVTFTKTDDSGSGGGAMDCSWCAKCE